LDIFDIKDKNRKSATTTIEEEEQQRDKSLVVQFLNWHYKLNHLSPAKMKSMAAQGLLPRKLINASVHICPACEFGKATRRIWRTKLSKRHQGRKLWVATRPGECISVN
jgi:GAG-pre-integrase domain